MSTSSEIQDIHLQHVIPEAKRDALKRLNYIDGHLSGIRRMVEQDKYCVDILKQTFAVRRAIPENGDDSLGGPPALVRNRGCARGPRGPGAEGAAGAVRPLGQEIGNGFSGVRCGRTDLHPDRHGK